MNDDWHIDTLIDNFFRYHTEDVLSAIALFYKVLIFLFLCNNHIIRANFITLVVPHSSKSITMAHFGQGMYLQSAYHDIFLYCITYWVHLLYD